MNAGTIIELFPRTRFKFTNLVVGNSLTVPMVRALDLSQFADATLVVRVHAEDVGAGGTVQVAVSSVSPTCEDPSVDFKDPEAVASITLDGDVAVGDLEVDTLSPTFGSHVQVVVTGTRPTTINVDVTISAELVVRTVARPVPKVVGDFSLVSDSPTLRVGGGSGTGSIRGGDPVSGAGGAVSVVGGTGMTANNGGAVSVTGGTSGPTGAAAGGKVSIAGGLSSPATGGDVEIDAGGGGAIGSVKIGANQAGLLEIFGGTQHYGASATDKHRTTSGFSGSEVESMSTAGIQLAAGAAATTLKSFTLNTNGRHMKVFCWVTGQGNTTHTLFRSAMMVRMFTRSGGTVTAQTLTNLQALGTLGAATIDNSGDSIRIRVTGGAEISNWMVWYVVQIGGQAS